VTPNTGTEVGATVNLTGVHVFGGSEPTFISALPAPVASGSPTTSTVNLVRGQVRANMAILPVGPDGKIWLFNLAGEVRMVVDVVAYLQSGVAEDTRGGRVVPLRSPFRAFDTREKSHGDQPLGPAQAEDWSFESFADDVRIGSEAVGPQSALIGNLTLAELQPQYPWAAPALTHMTAYPSHVGGSATPPLVSNVNMAQGDIVPNLALLPYGTSDQGPYSIRFYNRAGYVDYLLDVYAVILQND
jgi:serine protease